MGEHLALIPTHFTFVERVLLKTFQNLRVSSPAPVTMASPSGDMACGRRETPAVLVAYGQSREMPRPTTTRHPLVGQWLPAPAGVPLCAIGQRICWFKHKTFF